MIIQDDSPNPKSAISPDLGSCYSHGLRQVSKYLGPYLLIFLVVLVFGIPSIISGFSNYTFDSYVIVNVILYAYSFFVTSPLEYGVSYAYLKGARGETPQVNDLAIVLKNYWNVILAIFLTGLIVGVGFFLLIIPGIIFMVKLAFVRYLVTDEKMSALAAIDTSWQMTGGYGWTIFGMGLLAIPIIIAGLLLFGIGVIFSSMWIESAFATLYHAVSTERKRYIAQTEPEQTPEPPQQGPFIE